MIIENNIEAIKEKTDIVSYETKDIKSLINCIRGKQVMLDSDVAMLYHYDTKNINKAMKRNIERFPEDFCFQITEKELENLMFQIGNLNSKEKMWFQSGTTLQKENIKYRSEKYLPYVYTEQGISMLAGILRNEIAVNVSINIMRAFVEMRKFISANGQVFERLTKVEYKLLEHDKKFDDVFNELQKDKKSEFKQKIFFEGQIYDAYQLIIKIIKRAKEKILIIDNYVDDSILEMLTKKNKNTKVVILTSNKSSISKLDIQKFNKEYPILEMAKTNKFHDRFIVIDNKEIYHVGASLKDLGKKCFAISKMEDIEYIEKVVEKCYQK